MPDNESFTDRLRQEFYVALHAKLSRSAKVVAALAKISEHKDTNFIKDVIPLLWDKNESVVFEVAATLSLLLPRLPIQSLPDFDSSIRASWPHWVGSGNLDGVQLERLKSSSAWWWSFAVLASHPSGFVRQAAIEELRLEESGESLPFILLRTSDWVEPVRRVACEILLQKLTRVNLDRLDECLPLVFRMRNALRHQPVAILEQIENLLSSRGGQILTGRYPNSSPAFLRYRFKLAKQCGQLPLDQLIGKASASGNIGLRLLACDWVAEAETPEQVRDTYAKVLVSDKVALVRVRAFWRIANADPQKYLPYIERALMDPSAAVQDTARGAWRLLLKRDAPAFYRKVITEVHSPVEIVSALRGLRAEGKLNDEVLVRPLLQHNSIKVRKEALRTLTWWDASDAPDLLREGLQSASPAYSKEAASLLRMRPKLLSIPLIKELLSNPRHGGARKIALWLLAVMPKWSRLPLILLVYSIPQNRDQALMSFSSWSRDYNRSFTQPSEMEKNEVIKAFDAIADLPLSKDRDLVSIMSVLKSAR